MNVGIERGEYYYREGQRVAHERLRKKIGRWIKALEEDLQIYPKDEKIKYKLFSWREMKKWIEKLEKKI